MNVITRGIRNAFRNSVRTVSIVLILGLSIGLIMAMTIARSSVQSKIDSVKESVGNSVNITPAGARDFMGGGEPLTVEQISGISKFENVSRLTMSLSDRLTSDSTSLESAVEAGSLGSRGAANSGVGFAPSPDSVRQNEIGTGMQTTRTFTPPVIVTGTNDLSTPSAYGGSTVEYISGEPLDPSQDKDVAVVGESLAEKKLSRRWLEIYGL